MKLFSKFPHWLKRKRVFIPLILIVIVLAVVFSRRNPSDQYETTFPVRESVVEYVTETGNVISTNAVPVYSTTNGVINHMAVANGSVVRMGDELFTVVSTTTSQEKATAWSNYLTAQTALESAKATEYSLRATMFNQWDEFKNLAENGTYEEENGTPRTENRTLPEFVISQNEWLSAESVYKNQLAVVSQKQADLYAKSLAYQATQDSIITAVAGGQVQNQSVDVGQSVAATTALSTPAPVLMIMTETKPTIKAQISETDYINVKPGQEVVIEVDALDTTELKGKVSRIDAIGTNTQGVITYNVYIEFDTQDVPVSPGMTATVDIEVARKDNALTVPSSAIKPYQGGRAVRVVGETGEIEYIPVETGVKGQTKTEILSGIDESTAVITALKNEQIQRSGNAVFGG
ncbi:MAG: HlyD family efflux transporter periplasmic adaptor subunit [Candidatus Roizmanbacteria bacterium]|nr:HlyD family efflux transporter periplasmic adaptor subunit [Candidatus Roizmanbacteria bacterium]